MRPTTAPADGHNAVKITEDNVFDFNALLHPGKVFRHPRDVVGSADLNLSEKRAPFWPLGHQMQRPSRHAPPSGLRLN